MSVCAFNKDNSNFHVLFFYTLFILTYFQSPTNLEAQLKEKCILISGLYLTDKLNIQYVFKQFTDIIFELFFEILNINFQNGTRKFRILKKQFCVKKGM